jgi:hypothetical protein
MWLVVLAVVLTAIIGLVIAAYLRQARAAPSPWGLPVELMEARFESAAAGVDRIVVAGNLGADKLDYPVLTFEGHREVQQFLSGIDIERPAGPCACEGDWRLRFYKGDQHILTLSTHHGERLRWRLDRWIGDAELTTEGKAWLADLHEKCIARAREVWEEETRAAPE